MELIIIYTIFGLIIGSFLSVCIYRIPLGRDPDDALLNPEDPETDQETSTPLPEKASVAPALPESPPTEEDARPISISYPPRSFCPSCNKQLRWWHNIPVLSWVFLGGKCAFCKNKISARYPCVELMSAVACVLSFTKFGLTPTGALIYIFCATLIVISFIDYDYYIIPNVISLPGTAIGFVIAIVNQFTGIFAEPVVDGAVTSLLGVLVGSGFLFLVSEVYLRARKQEGLGMGDVKLLAMTGALFGYNGALFTIFIGSLLGSVIGVSLILISGRKMSHQLPFGPYLAMGTILYLFVSTEQLLRAQNVLFNLVQHQAR